MTGTLEAQRPLNRTPYLNDRRKDCRLRPKSMIAVISSNNRTPNHEFPCVVLDFSLGGLAILTEQDVGDLDEGYLSIYYRSIGLKKIPFKIVSKFRVGPITRLNIQMNSDSTPYLLQKSSLKLMELNCIMNSDF